MELARLTMNVHQTRSGFAFKHESNPSSVRLAMSLGLMLERLQRCQVYETMEAMLHYLTA